MLCGGNITTSGSPWAPAGAAVLMQVATCSKGIGGGTPRMRGSRQLAHWSARNPRPDAAAWIAIPSLEPRARRAFGELYGWFRDHADELYPINRDAAAMPLSAQRAREAGTAALADAILARQAGDDTDARSDGRLLRAVARHLVDFWTWRSLVMQQGLDDDEAVEVAVTLLTAIAGDAPG